MKEPLANDVLADINDNGGKFTLADIENYELDERKSVSKNFNLQIFVDFMYTQALESTFFYQV